MRRRGSSGEFKNALPVGVAQALRGEVNQLSLRLLQLAPAFPLTRDELELMHAPPNVLKLLRDAAVYMPDSMYRVQGITVKSKDATTGGIAVEWRITINAVGHSYRNRDPGFLVPDEAVDGYTSPPELVAKLRPWVRQRYALGVEAGAAAKYVADFLLLCKSPLQVKKLWPELLDFASRDDDVRVLKSKLSANEAQRARVPNGWGIEWERGLEMARATLAKCSMLPGTVAPKTGLVLAALDLHGVDSPRAKWNNGGFVVF